MSHGRLSPRDRFESIFPNPSKNLRKEAWRKTEQDSEGRGNVQYPRGGSLILDFGFVIFELAERFSFNPKS
jgi:hypothetical protein